MSLFRIVKYSSLLFFLGKYKSKLFRVVAVLLFALITSLLYQDVADYLAQQYPETVIYALLAKMLIVYGALGFVLLQFRPEPDVKGGTETRVMDDLQHSSSTDKTPDTAPQDTLAGMEDVSKTATLHSRYDKLIGEKSDPKGHTKHSSRDQS